MYKTYKVLGILLTYPESAWIENLEEFQTIMENEGLLCPLHQQSLRSFCEHLKTENLFRLQEHYVEWFDRTPSLSLHLFEHVHGESRSRGQAMVDLLTVYQKKGISLKNGELPDYLPAFLEFLSHQSPHEARDLLKEAQPIISAIGERLKQKKIGYHVVFDALLISSPKIMVKPSCRPA
ncbi:MAG: nitrate reductase molybdenum cofactor assembly chaperone [Gammaproteobacteria bacterium]|nr:nitrate reductase molybdenum cofactor assembly chaperone [Gammaproteobacteria bacterium]